MFIILLRNCIHLRVQRIFAHKIVYTVVKLLKFFEERHFQILQVCGFKANTDISDKLFI